MDDLDLNSLLDKAPPERSTVSLNDDGEVVSGLPIPEKPKRIESLLHRTRRRFIVFAAIAIPTTVITGMLIIIGLTVAGIWSLQYLTMPDPRPCIARLSSSRLAFSLQSTSSLQSGIYVTDMNGTATCLVSNIADATSLAWSSSMKRIDVITHASSGDDQVYTVDLAGLSQHLDIEDHATSGVHTFKSTWSPDGTKLIDAKYIVDLKTGSYRQLTMDQFVSWSPDSQHIIYFPYYEDGRLDSIDADGSNLRSLASGIRDQEYGNRAFWLPDEQHIVLTDEAGIEYYDGVKKTLLIPGDFYGYRFFPSPDGKSFLMGNFSLEAMDLASKRRQQLTLPPDSGGSGNSLINWSPDSRYFAIVRGHNVPIPTAKVDSFYIVSADDKSVRAFPVQGGDLISNIIWIS